MKQTSFLLAAPGILLLFTGISPLSSPIEKTETIQRTFRFSDLSNARLTVDNIHGSIEITGYDGDTVQMTCKQKIRANSENLFETAREETKLDISEHGNAVVLFVDAPYRCRDGSTNHRGWDDYGYEAKFDFKIQVPVQTSLNLKTINDGEIVIHNVHGDFKLKNINGGIMLKGVAGSGEVYALNGDVRVEFARNPTASCSFGSLNGEVEVSFKDDLAADFRFKTFNGDVYTDFPVTHLQSRAATKQHKDGRFVYKADDFFGARVGKGGPEFHFDAFNGDIHVTKAGEIK